MKDRFARARGGYNGRCYRRVEFRNGRNRDRY